MQNAHRNKPKDSKKSLTEMLSEGQIVNRAWLLRRGINRPLVDYYLRTGKLITISRGFYRRPGPALKWEHVIFSLINLEYQLHIGGKTALAYYGLFHFLQLARKVDIAIFCNRNLPSWINKLNDTYQFHIIKTRLFPASYRVGIRKEPFGSWDWPLPYSISERALLESVSQIQKEADFKSIDKIFDGAVNLIPEVLQELLEKCINVKTKRLFLWFAKKHSHKWFGKLEINKIDLGKGKRQIIKAGKLDNSFQITIPKGMSYEK